MAKVAILGCGSWGTALGVHLAKKNISVNMWSHMKEDIDKLNESRENSQYLPKTKIPEIIKFTNDIDLAVNETQFIVTAVPSHAVREVLSKINGLKETQIIVNVAKGVENNSLLTMSQVIKEVHPNNRIVALYGPSHAEEVAQDIPTAIVSASEDEDAAKAVQDLFMTPAFRVYTNSDVIGVEIGGSIKNVVALCAGVSDGLGFGDNTKAALMTRGLAEISRLGIAMGANPLTFAGLSGIGDLIVTCTSMHSRNRRCGILIGQGKTLEEAQKEIHMVVEGVKTAKSAYDLSKKLNVSMPITQQAFEVLFNNKDPREAVYDLMMRDKKDEI